MSHQNNHVLTRNPQPEGANSGKLPSQSSRHRSTLSPTSTWIAKSQSLSTKPIFNILLPMYPSSRTQSNAATRTPKSLERKNPTILRISPLQRISSINGLWINLISDDKTQTEHPEAIAIKALMVGPIKTNPTNTFLLNFTSAAIVIAASSFTRFEIELSNSMHYRSVNTFALRIKSWNSKSKPWESLCRNSTRTLTCCCCCWSVWTRSRMLRRSM